MAACCVDGRVVVEVTPDELLAGRVVNIVVLEFGFVVGDVVFLLESGLCETSTAAGEVVKPMNEVPVVLALKPITLLEDVLPLIVPLFWLDFAKPSVVAVAFDAKVLSAAVELLAGFGPLVVAVGIGVVAIAVLVDGLA